MEDRLSGMNEGLHKAKSGLIRVLVKVGGGKISDIIISGDYIMTPEYFADKMEEKLLGIKADNEAILSALKTFFQNNKFQCPQTYPEDFAAAINKAIEGGEKK